MKTKKVKSKYPLAETFLFYLDEDISRNEISLIYYQLFSMMSLKMLDIVLNDYKLIWSGKNSYFKEYGKTEWFAAFHKSIRQIGLFDDCYKEESDNVMSDKDREEYRFLQHKVRGDKYEKRDPENKKIFSSEYRRYLELCEMSRKENNRVSINGKLNSIIYTMIHMDSKNYLYKTMDEVFSYE